MTPSAREMIESLLESPIVKTSHVTGGDINEAHRVKCANGRILFVKTNPNAPGDMFQREAEGLDWLQGKHGLRVPQVLYYSKPNEPAYLIMEWIAPARRVSKFDENLGRGLAKLHLDSPGRFGWHANNFIGHLPQTNSTEPTWVEFYREQRLLPQIQMANQMNRLSADAMKALEHLLSRLEDHLPLDEPPARLHGDLWNGNVHTDESGQPVLIDPAVYGGHREIDLAMMKLFGGFSERTFQAYHETYPLEPGWETRIELNQLYPLLVHVNLFGGHYAQSVERIANRYN